MKYLLIMLCLIAGFPGVHATSPLSAGNKMNTSMEVVADPVSPHDEDDDKKKKCKKKHRHYKKCRVYNSCCDNDDNDDDDDDDDRHCQDRSKNNKGAVIITFPKVRIPVSVKSD